MRSIKMKRYYGFTLAEVLITLAIIGVVAALSIPAVISNSQQQEFKTGLRKAVSVLNSAITMNMALDGESPYDNANTFAYLQKHMSVLKSTTKLPWDAYFLSLSGVKYHSYFNAAFYTTDGMRFEVDDNSPYIDGTQSTSSRLRLHESKFSACLLSANIESYTASDGYRVACGGCGSYGLNHNPNNTTKVPCAILVDVNGDKKPTPQTVCTTLDDCPNNEEEKYWVPALESKKVSDIFVILITDDRAIPYGVVAQKAMYQAQK